jgi:hypothetical protein
VVPSCRLAGKASSQAPYSACKAVSAATASRQRRLGRGDQPGGGCGSAGCRRSVRRGSGPGVRRRSWRVRQGDDGA